MRANAYDGLKWTVKWQTGPMKVVDASNMDIGIQIYQYGYIVQVTVGLTVDLPGSWSYVQLGVLPSMISPPKRLVYICCTATDKNLPILVVRLGTDRKIFAMAQGGTPPGRQDIYGTGPYIVEVL